MEKEHKEEVRWDRTHTEYTCADGAIIICGVNAAEIPMLRGY